MVIRNIPKILLSVPCIMSDLPKNFMRICSDTFDMFIYVVGIWLFVLLLIANTNHWNHGWFAVEFRVSVVCDWGMNS